MTQGAEHILLEEQQFWKHRIHQIDQEEDKSTAAGLLYDIFRQALERKASDIHLEPQRDGLLVRLRCDGVLQALQGIDSALQMQIVNRLKVMAELDITEKRLPQGIWPYPGRENNLMCGCPVCRYFWVKSWCCAFWGSGISC